MGGAAQVARLNRSLSIQARSSGMNERRPQAGTQEDSDGGTEETYLQAEETEAPDALQGRRERDPGVPPVR